MLQTLLSIIHVTVCVFLILVVLLQQGRGGGMGSAFGGATAQVFGGRGAGNFLTRLTGICAALFILKSGGLAYPSPAGARDIKAGEKKQQRQQRRRKWGRAPRAPGSRESISRASPRCAPRSPPSCSSSAS